MTMKKTLLLSALAVVLSLTACNKEIAENGTPAPSVGQTVRFTSVAPETKAAFTTPNGTHYPVLWTSNDTQMAVTMNYSSSPVTADVTRSADNKTASFNAEFETGAAEYTFVAVSPAASVKSVYTAEKRVNIEVPTGQTPTSTSPDEDAMVLYAKSAALTEFPESVDLTFHHFTGYLHLKFTNYAAALAAESATVQSVSITSDKDIAGRVFFFPETGATSANAMSKTVTVTTSSLDDVWVALAPVDFSNETLAITIGTDKGTISKDVGFSSGCNLTSGKIAKVTVDLNGIDIVAPVQYDLVTAENQLHIGDHVIIVAANSDYALSTTQNKNNRAATGITKGAGVILDPSDAVQVIELTDGVKPGEYALKVGTEYLYAACGTDGTGNYLRTAAFTGAAAAYASYGSFEISILDGQTNGANEPSAGTTDNVAKVYAATNARGLIRFNNSGLFSAYTLTTTTNFIHMYRLHEDPDLSARFKASMPDDTDGDGNLGIVAAGGSLEVYVFGNSAWTASATGGATLDSASGTGNAILTLTVPENASTTDTKDYTVTVSTSAGVVPNSYTFSITQAVAAGGGSSTPKIGDVLWSETWVGGTNGDRPSAYAKGGTEVYGGATVTYTDNGASTKLQTDGLVYVPSNYSGGVALPDDLVNLLIAKTSGWWNIDGIPCSGVKVATITFDSNYSTLSSALSTTTEDVTIGTITSTNDNSAWGKKVYHYTCDITFPDGADPETFNLKFSNTSGSNNRVDTVSLVVKTLK